MILVLQGFLEPLLQSVTVTTSSAHTAFLGPIRHGSIPLQGSKDDPSFLPPPRLLS